MKRTAGKSDQLRQLLIGYREYTLPKSTRPPRWSAPAGQPDPLLDALKAGQPVPLDSSLLMSAMMAAGLPDAAHKRFWYGGVDADKLFQLDGQGRLSEISDEEYERLYGLIHG